MYVKIFLKISDNIFEPKNAKMRKQGYDSTDSHPLQVTYNLTAITNLYG